MGEKVEAESHPSFGWARAGKVSHSPPGIGLFDSDIRHQHYVTLSISRATRRRELNRDWLHGENDEIVEVSMSMAQWGALVSSFGSSGVPCTITRLERQLVEQPPHAPRFEHSVREVEGSVDKLLAEVKDDLAALEEAFERKAGRKEMGTLLNNLHHALRNATPNARYAANTLTEHVEKVITKAKYDIEAVVQAAAQRGIEAGGVIEALGMGDDEPTDDDIDFARDTLGPDATDAEVYDLASQRAARDKVDTPPTVI